MGLFHFREKYANGGVYVQIHSFKCEYWLKDIKHKFLSSLFLRLSLSAFMRYETFAQQVSQSPGGKPAPAS